MKYYDAQGNERPQNLDGTLKIPRLGFFDTWIGMLVGGFLIIAAGGALILFLSEL